MLLLLLLPPSKKIENKKDGFPFVALHALITARGIKKKSLYTEILYVHFRLHIHARAHKHAEGYAWMYEN
jgi:hypothetical protein